MNGNVSFGEQDANMAETSKPKKYRTVILHNGADTETVKKIINAFMKKEMYLLIFSR